MNNVLKNVGQRTNGELFVAIIAPTRSGKSLFIRNFMKKKILPYITDNDMINKITDELPVSGDGKTIMTVEPKFVPSNISEINIGNEMKLNVRLVDCVGYIIPNAVGHLNEDGTERLVHTPWFNSDIPFSEASVVGTRKVMENHSNIGIVLTSDGSFGEFSRNDYKSVEDKIIKEMKDLNKPFVVIVNSAKPDSREALEIVDEIKEKYDVEALSVDCKNMDESEIDNILNKALEEFPISKLDINIPEWILELPDNNKIKKDITEMISNINNTYTKFKDATSIREKLYNLDIFESVVISDLNSATGEVIIDVSVKPNLYKDTLEELLGSDILNNKASFLKFITNSLNNNNLMEEYVTPIKEAVEIGYGVSVPNSNNMKLATPEVVKNGNRYGIKLKAVASSIHMIKVDVESSFEPIIGSYEQSKAIIDKLTKDFESNPDGIWQTEIFGRKLNDVVNDGIKAKLYMLSDDTKYKMRESLEKIVNKGKGGILAFIL